LQEAEAGRQRRESLAAYMRVHQPRGNLEILAALGNGFARKLDHLRVIRHLQGAFPSALRRLDIFAPRLFELVRYRVVTKIDAARIIAGNGIQEVFSEGHNRYAAEVEDDSSVAN
jgi:hypothetical protein